jgi:hypothetical protein
MFLKLTLYLLFGLISLFFIKIQTFADIVKAVLFVIFWPFYLLLKYVQIVDEVKNSGFKSTKKGL